MLTENKIPFVNENENKNALKIIQKRTGFVVVVNNDGLNK